MATAQSRAVVTPVAEVAVPRMANSALASGMAIRGAPLRPLQKRPAASRRVAATVKAVASPVKPTAPAKKGDLISAEQAKELYRDMVLGREFEEMCAQMYYRGKMFGFVHLYSGQEAVSTGESRIKFGHDLGQVALIRPYKQSACHLQLFQNLDLYLQIQYSGRILRNLFNFYHLGPHALAIPITNLLVFCFAGVIKACLRKDDYVSSTYRDHVHALSKGVSARKVMAELFGKKTGTCRGQGGSMHMFDAEFGLVSHCIITE